MSASLARSPAASTWPIRSCAAISIDASRFSSRRCRRVRRIVIGSGLAGLTAANTLARAGHRVLLFEQHYKLGGMATWFKRPGGHIFDISLHGFPVGMIKSCRRYWTSEIADSIVQLKHIRFDNPMFSLTTTFNREDFTRLLIEQFDVPAETRDGVFRHRPRDELLRRPDRPRGQLFEQFFPGREDVIRLLMEPITYANGSTLEDPAISYGIVFSNFMSKGVFTFEGGTDRLIKLMQEELEHSGVDVRIKCDVREDPGRPRPACGRRARQRPRRSKHARSSRTPILKATIFKLVGEAAFRPRLRRRGPGRAAEQFQHAGLHGLQARRGDRRELRRPAVQFDRAAVSHRAVA